VIGTTTIILSNNYYCNTTYYNRYKMENKRDIWSYDETLILINILKEKNILMVMDNKRFRIAEIFKSVEKDMKNKGYCRSATQIHIKFKALKRKYNFKFNILLNIFLE